MGNLQGKVALVTGAGQGVGQGIAFALANEGVSIVLAGRTESKLVTSLEEIEKRGGKACIATGDVKSADDLAGFVAKAESEFGGLDILVNNAQEVPLGPLEKVSDEAFLGGFESGPLATLRLMKLAKPIMAARGGGVMINLVSSAGVRWDMANYGADGSIKQAIRPLTRAAASEWGAEDIRVLAIAPHANSPSLQAWIDRSPAEAEHFFKTIPLKRIGDCEDDIGSAVVALCSPEMKYLTGATIPLDGGQANFD